MADTQHEVGDVITTYVYRQEEPTELIGTYAYGHTQIMFLFIGLIVIVSIVFYRLGKKFGNKNK
ncbi:MAG: hypothetical protein RR627_09070 [Niameybacter sp.]